MSSARRSLFFGPLLLVPPSSAWADGTEVHSLQLIAPYAAVGAALLATAVALYFHIQTLRLNTAAHNRTTDELRRAQTWKQREFVASWFEKLRTDDQAQTAMTALDYAGVLLQINAPHDWKGGEKPERYPVKDSGYFVRIGTAKTFMALVPHNFPGVQKRFTDEHMQLKLCFDALFTRLDSLQSMITAELVSYADIEPYIGYWMQLLRGERTTLSGETLYPSANRKAIFAALKLYLETYGYDGVVALGRKSGNPLTPQDNDRKCVADKLQELFRPLGEGDAD